MILAIDFDGTIHDNLNPVPGMRMGEPMPGAKEALEDYRARGWEIHVYTIWEPRSHNVIMDWMDYYSLPFDMVTNRKQHADVYIDNRAVRFIDWEDAREQVLAVLVGG